MNFKHNARACLFFLLFSTVPILSYGGQPSIRDDQLKAVYLYNFLHFISWPVACKVPFNETPITIGVIGSSPVGLALDDLAKSISESKKRPMNVIHHNTGDDITNCQILFVSTKEAHRFQDILPSIKAPVLTVADTEDFLNNGGMITMLTIQDKVRYNINRSAAKAAGLRLNSQLLNTALEVH